MGLLDPLPSPDVIYGIRRENIAGRLTSRNWKDKAVVRLYGDAWLYTWIRRVTDTNEGCKEVPEYHVRVHGPSEHAGLYEQSFGLLKKALDYVNGDDGGWLARDTTAARPDQYPPDQEPQTLLATK